MPFGDAWTWGLVLGGALVFVFDHWDLKGLAVAIVGMALWATEHYELRIKYVWPVLLMVVGGFLKFQAMVRNRGASERPSGDSRHPRILPQGTRNSRPVRSPMAVAVPVVQGYCLVHASGQTLATRSGEAIER